MKASTFTSKKLTKDSPFYSALNKEQLAAYFRRIGFEEQPQCSFECLQRLHYLHSVSLPFENFNPLLRIPIALDQHSLVNKMVKQKRGGYCFEHNLLFGGVLSALGFEVTCLAARVMWQVPEEVIMPRDHQLLLVNFGEDLYIADVGFGGNTLTSALSLNTSGKQSTSHEPFKITEDGDAYLLHIQVNKGWGPMYRFGLEEYLLPDFEVINYYLCNHEQSMFVNHLFLAQTKEEGRFGLFDDQFSFHPLKGKTQKEKIHTVDQLMQKVENVFNIEVPNPAALAHWFNRRSQVDI
jgi:N-hydroxyarylamine O-acetyltransferase